MRTLPLMLLLAASELACGNVRKALPCNIRGAFVDQNGGPVGADIVNYVPVASLSSTPRSCNILGTNGNASPQREPSFFPSGEPGAVHFQGRADNTFVIYEVEYPIPEEHFWIEVLSPCDAGEPVVPVMFEVDPNRCEGDMGNIVVMTK